MTWRASREIVERIIVEGDLILITPTLLGNGDTEGLTDMSLLLDEVDKTALLTGTSIAGALRNYLREHLLNFGISEESQYKENGKRRKDSNGKDLPLPIVTQLFGSLEDDGAQSLLIIDDARSIDETGKPKRPATELRDGVRIDGKTRTAYLDNQGKGSKFDLELLEAGTIFKLRLELLISEGSDRNKLISAFATALRGFEKREGFESGEIHLGARKRRGYGECKVESWRFKSFDLKTPSGLIDWLKNGATELPKENEQPISQALKPLPIKDCRAYFELNGWFALDGSMLIRSGSRPPEIINQKGQPDTVHLRSKRNGKSKAIVSGTSLAGVLRHRAVKICNTLKDHSGEEFVEKMFGVDMEKRPEEIFASRLEVKETVIDENKTNSLIQTRVKIDRFTGGAYEGALFDAAPVFSDGEKQVINLKLRLRAPEAYEIGLLLLLLKDLWTSDLPIGGESSIGRGRLKGISAMLHNRKNDDVFWKISLEETDKIGAQLVDGKLPNNETATMFLNDLVGKLKVELEKGDAKN